MIEFLTPEQVLFIHARVIAETGGASGVRDFGLLLSAVARPRAAFGDQDFYPGIFDRAAALLDSLIRNHPFADGNKRTGITAATLFLQRNGYHLKAVQDELVSFTVSCAQSELTLSEIADWFRGRCK